MYACIHVYISTHTLTHENTHVHHTRSASVHSPQIRLCVAIQVHNHCLPLPLLAHSVQSVCQPTQTYSTAVGSFRHQLRRIWGRRGRFPATVLLFPHLLQCCLQAFWCEFLQSSFDGRVARCVCVCVCVCVCECVRMHVLGTRK
jgi:hypothetical protein